MFMVVHGGKETLLVVIAFLVVEWIVLFIPICHKWYQ